MYSLAERYRLVHQQGFVPIFVSDHFDAVQLAEASVCAGAKVVEVTCRRTKVCDEIRRIRKAFPDLLILVGSIVDDGPMLRFLQKRRPDVPSIEQLLDIGVDGFVSALPLLLDTVRRLSPAHLFIPGVETVAEAVQVVEAGAHFVKFFNTATLGEHKRVALATGTGLHNLLPIFVTGGVTLEKIDAYVQARVALLGSGWGVLLGDRYEIMQDNPDTTELASTLRTYLETMTKARTKYQPMPMTSGIRDYFKALPHYHPFDKLIDP